jgi:hypothetical protein
MNQSKLGMLGRLKQAEKSFLILLVMLLLHVISADLYAMGMNYVSQHPL